MCTVGVAVGLAALQGYQQYQAVGAQYDSQANQYTNQAQQYEQQAKIDRQNAAIEEKKAESTAESYAQQSEALRDKRRLIAGANAASAGSSGLVSGYGSTLDILAASTQAYNKDQANLLTNQRNSIWDTQTTAVNYRNQANASDANAQTALSMADYTRTNKKAAQFGTLLGTASSITSIVGGVGGGGGSTSSSANSGYAAIDNNWSVGKQSKYTGFYDATKNTNPYTIRIGG